MTRAPARKASCTPVLLLCSPASYFLFRAKAISPTATLWVYRTVDEATAAAVRISARYGRYSNRGKFFGGSLRSPYHWFFLPTDECGGLRGGSIPSTANQMSGDDQNNEATGRVVSENGKCLFAQEPLLPLNSLLRPLPLAAAAG